jgi:transcriptional regulator with GAF, ATPase, and Fis domain
MQAVRPSRTSRAGGGNGAAVAQVGQFGETSEKGKVTVYGSPLISKGNTVSTLADAEREQILRALHEANWVVGGPNGAAARLGVNRSNLQWKMKKLGISRP